MQKEASKKGFNKKWLLLIAGVVVLVAALVLVLTMCGGNSDKENPDASYEIPTLYWNLDKKLYAGMSEAGTSGREPGEDGLYHVRFVVDGGVKEFACKDKRLIDKIDIYSVMGLTLDADGLIVDVLNVDDISGGIIANEFYVSKVEGDTITVNSAESLNGMDIPMTITEDTQIMDVSPECENPGTEAVLDVLDRVVAVAAQKDSQEVIYVYAVERAKEAEIYWNVTRMYNSTEKKSTRVANADGEFEILMATGGKQVVVKTKIQAVVNSIDAQAASCMGLIFNEEGYAVEVIGAGTATRGGTGGSWVDVMEINGRTVFSEKTITSSSSTGDTYTETLAENVQIYDVSGAGEYIGVPTELRVTDRIHSLKDRDGNLCVVFVVNRMVDANIFWNTSRKWDSVNACTKRQPASDGYYYIEVWEFLPDGAKKITLKTQDKELVNKIDKDSGLKVGITYDETTKEVTGAYPANLVTGWSSAAGWFDVTAVNGSLITAVNFRLQNGASAMFMMTPDCKVYNMSETAGSEKGRLDEVKMDDRIIALRNNRGEASIVVIVERCINSPIYWNCSGRKYDDTTKQTTRTPDEYGYYNFSLTYNGNKPKVFRTKSKAVASKIDSYTGYCFSAITSGDIILDTYSVKWAKGVGNSTAAAWYTLQYWIDGETFFAKKLTKTAADYGKTAEVKITDETRVYCVGSSAYVDYIGEPTNIRVGDQVYVMQNKQFKAHTVFIVGRTIDAPIAYNPKPMWDYTNSVNKREQNADGYWYIDLAINGEMKTYKTNKQSVIDLADKYTSAKIMGAVVKGDELLKVMDAAATKIGKGGLVNNYFEIVSFDADGKGAHLAKLTPSSADYGTEMDVKFASNMQVYDISPEAVAAGTDGQKTTLKLGDRLRYVQNTDKKITVCYVIQRNTHGEDNHFCDHCGEEVYWSAWDGTTNLTNSGHYYLTKDVTSSTIRSINNGADIVLCLNGKTLTSKTKLFTVSGNATLTIVDHNDPEHAGTLQAKGTAPSSTKVEHSGVFQLYSNKVTETQPDGTPKDVYQKGTLNLYNGTLKLMDDHNELTGGGVGRVGWNTTFNMYGGKLIGNDLTKPAGSINENQITGGTLWAEGTINLYNGYIGGGKANQGGNIYLHNTTATPTLNIGNVKGDEKYTGQMIIEGGQTVATGTAYGGNICVGQGNLNIYDGAVITGGISTTFGGGNIIGTGAKSTINIYGGEIKGGQAANGGNICLYEGSKLYVTGGEILNGTAKGSGGNIFFSKNATVELSDTLISGGTATTSGGNIAAVQTDSKVAVNGTLKIGKGAIVEAGTASNGANVIASSTSPNATVEVTVEGLVAGDFNVATNDIVLNVAGNARIESAGTATNGYDLMLASGTLMNLGELTDEAKIVVTATGVFTNALADQATAEKYVADYISAYNGSTIEITPEFALTLGDDGTKYQCVCGGKAEGMEGHTCQAVAFKPWESGTTLPINGNYYLTQDVTLSKYVGLDNGAKVVLNLDLNGYDITYVVPENLGTLEATGGVPNTTDNDKTYNFAIFNIWKSSELTITDSTDTPGTIKLEMTDFVPTTAQADEWNAAGTYDAEVKKRQDVRDKGVSGGIVSVGTGIFNLYDGIIDGSAHTGKVSGLLINVPAGGTFNMYGGEIKGGQTTVSANIYLVNTAVMNMYGGKISGGKGVYGGNLNLYKSSGDVYPTLNMVGGEITGGTASSGGGNIYGGGVMNIGGNAKITSGGIAFTTHSTLTLTGTPTISTIMVQSSCTKLFDATGLDAAIPAESIVVDVVANATNLATRPFATVANADMAAAFKTTNATYGLVAANAENQLYLTVDTREKMCVCGGKAAGIEGHTCEEIPYSEWTSETELPTSGNYKLTKDITTSANWQTPNGKLNLDLNGFDVTYVLPADATAANDMTLFAILNDAEVSITDSTDTPGTLAVDYSNLAERQNKNGGALVNITKGTFTLYNGTLNGSGFTGRKDGLVAKIALGSTFNLYGGKIDMTGNQNPGNGPMIENKGILNMYGGEIDATGTTCDYSGLVMKVIGEEAFFNMYDGTIKGGTGAGNANIYLQTKGNMVMSGGTITGCKAKNGGAIHVPSGTVFTMTGGTIKDSTATVTGGAIYAAGTVNIGGTAVVTGGVSIFQTATVTLTGTPTINTLMVQSSCTKLVDATGLDAGIAADQVAVKVIASATNLATRPFATVANAAMAEAFKTTNTDYTVISVDASNQLYLTEATP